MSGDNNGNVTVPKWFLTVVTLLILIISSVAAVVAVSVTTKNNVEYNSGLITSVEEIQKVQEQRLVELEKTIPVIDIRLENIEEGNDAIKKHLGII